MAKATECERRLGDTALRRVPQPLNAGEEWYVQARDIVCIKAGDEHDILEVYGDEDFELFWLYEPGPAGARLGHLHRSPEREQPHPVPAKPVPPDFPAELSRLAGRALRQGPK